MSLCTGKDVVKYLDSVMEKVVQIYQTAEVMNSTRISNAVVVFIIRELYLYKFGSVSFT